MYHQTYSSSIISLRTSLSLNDYSYYSNERCPSSYSSCCCSNLSRFVVPIVNPSFLYGLRQSTLIQCPPTRRVMFGSRSPVYDAGLCCNGDWCCVKSDRVAKEKCCCENISVNRQQLLPKYVLPTRGVGRSRCKSLNLAEGGSKTSVNVKVDVNTIRDRLARRNYRCNAFGDAEAMLSLLTEEPVEQFLDVRGRRPRSSKYVDVNSTQNGVCMDSRHKKGNIQLGKLHVELTEIKSKEEVNKRREEDSEDFSRWSTKNEFDSSYYSASDTSDLESDVEVEIQDERLASVRHVKDSKRIGSVVIKGEKVKEPGRLYRDQEVHKNAHYNDFRVGSSVAFNSKEKSESIVFSDKAKRESEWNRDARNHQQLQSNKHDEVRLGSVTEWDWRNKSEKRLTEESAEETKSRKDSVVRHSQTYQTETDSSTKASGLGKQFNYQEEGSTSGISLHGKFRSHIGKDNQEQSTQPARHDTETTSDIQGRLKQGQEGMAVVGQSVQEIGCKYCETCMRIMQQNKTQTGFQQMTELSEIRDDARLTSTLQSESESRLRKQQNKTQTGFQQMTELSEIRDDARLTSTLQSESESRLRKQKSSTSLQTSTQEMRAQHNSVTADSHDSYSEGTSSSQQQSDANMKSLEKKSSLLVKRQDEEVKGSKKTSGCKVSKENESSRVAQTGISASQVHATKAEINRQSASEQHQNQTIYAHHNYAEDTLSARQQSDTNKKNLQEISSSVISQGFIEEIESSRLGQTGTSASQTHSTSEQRIYEEQIYSTKVKSEEVLIEKHKYIDEANVQSIVRTEIQKPIVEMTYSGNLSGEATISQPSIALIFQTGVQQVSDGQNITRKDSGEITQVEAGSVYINPQVRIPSSSTEVSSMSESYEDPSRGDSLGSAERMEESSVQIVGGFIEDMRHEASTQDSRLQAETGSEHRHPQARIPPYDELSGGRSESSHEYALVSTELVGEFVETMQYKASTSHSTHQDEKYILKESTRSDSEKSMFQKQELKLSSGSSETKGPSDEMWDAKDHFAQESSERDSSKSTTSENVTVRTGKSLWRILACVLRLQSGSTSKTQKSSRSSEDEVDEANGNVVKTKDTTQEPSSRNRRDGLGRMTLDDRMSYIEVGASSSSSVLQTSSPIFNVIQETPQSSPLDLTVSVDMGQPGLENTSEVTNVEPKQSKLQRANQVLHETYSEWEDAYRRERDEREIDEKFMREALVEAKKASDSWEVPVGAVLVQNGNIIARGYNLVEELRDSTAHAEMICIREASNVLQTWRLSETTLYVTLEPCPMCAGAILQARVGTLVWGAPNKLLGADGSWIRLFRDGLAEEEERPEVSDKPAAPVHPFHTNMKIRRGVLESECADIMQQFFQLRRRKEKPSQEPSQRPKLSHKLFKFPLIHKKRSS